MTEKQILLWIRDNLGAIISKAIFSTPYSEHILAGMCMRETGILIPKKIGLGELDYVSAQMLGDYGKRKNDTEKKYHGFGFWQIDIDSFPEFVASGDWKDPYKCCLKAVSILEGKRKWLAQKNITEDRAIIAAYNCGEGNVWKAIKKGFDVDAYTYNKDYSKEVMRFAEIYANL